MSLDKKVVTVATSIKYKDGQLRALEGLVKWVNTDTRLFAVLEGAAGTGKTTILRDFVKNIKIGSSACSAPTHKAVEVIKRSTNITSFTIQKLLGLRPNTSIENFDINNPKFDPNGTPKIGDYKIIIIDEASMIDSGLLSLIKKEAEEHKSKILFVGDPYQLPPVGERISPVFNIQPNFKLTEIVRQEEGNPLLTLLAEVRRSVQNKDFNFMRYLKRNHDFTTDDGLGYICVDNSNFTDLVDQFFTSDNFRNDINYCRYAAFTNDNIMQWNNYIRSITIKSQDTVHPDDLLTAYNTILDEFNAPVITNSDDYLISNLYPMRNSYMINGFILNLKSLTDGTTSSPIFVVNHQDPEARNQYLTTANELIYNAKRANYKERARAWEAFYRFKDNNLTLVTFKDDGGRPITSKDLDFGYGITVHKTQGSTFDNIFINLYNIMYDKYNRPYPDRNMITRLMYVALSRARHKAIILM